ncbi:MAG: enoyl-CoA hydratase/isomerase family protein [Candidatus Thermoplasmatota archaeon]|jgi:enoyl-CoA hydratase|nr:enoyl-CoA hydratase/isomerase family protein [Candidatus Thermoplasmatota archaeon]MCL5962859.1 enoyl-CoA hydratase/isomerase family protein [Candidatus Thermoplasmatota archaeon]
MNKELIRLEIKGDIAYIIMNNPPLNIFTRQMLSQFSELLKKLEDKSCNVRVAILKSDVPNLFSAGADVKTMVDLSVEDSKEFSRLGQDITRRIELLPIPVIVSLDGFVLGGGSEIALACDFRIASDRILIGQPEINIGVIPGWGGSQRLPRTVGIANARLITYTGRKFNADEAVKMGYVDMVVPSEKLSEETDKLALEISSKGRVALAAMKNAMHLSWDLPLDKSLELEREIWGILFATNDQKEGMRAFLEHRAAQFRDPRSYIDLLKPIEKEEKNSGITSSFKESKGESTVGDFCEDMMKINLIGMNLSDLYIKNTSHIFNEWERLLRGQYK